MTTVLLQLPAEVLAELDLPYDGSRDLGDIQVIIDAVNVVASVVSLTTITPQLSILAGAIRSWLGRRKSSSPLMLTVKGDGLNLTLKLDPNISKAEIMSILAKLAPGI